MSSGALELIDDYGEQFASGKWHDPLLRVLAAPDLDRLSYALAHNFGDTLRRSREHYYRKIERGEQPAAGGSGIVSPHERVTFRHQIAADDIAPDALPRVLLRDGFIAPGSAGP